MRVDSDKPKIGHQRYLRGGRHSTQLECYAITKCVEGRRKVLSENEPAKIIIGALDWLRQRGDIKLLGFCVMPDHYHLLFVLGSQRPLDEVMKSVGKYTATQINKLYGFRGSFWQDGFHDHCCRDNDDVSERLTYIELNPVRAGLVADIDSWPYSSAFPSNAIYLDRHWYKEHC